MIPDTDRKREEIYYKKVTTYLLVVCHYCRYDWNCLRPQERYTVQKTILIHVSQSHHRLANRVTLRQDWHWSWIADCPCILLWIQHVLLCDTQFIFANKKKKMKKTPDKTLCHWWSISLPRAILIREWRHLTRVGI